MRSMCDESASVAVVHPTAVIINKKNGMLLSYMINMYRLHVVSMLMLIVKVKIIRVMMSRVMRVVRYMLWDSVVIIWCVAHVVEDASIDESAFC